MKGLILAAGRGSRMGGMTDVQPKCLTELHGKSLLDWQINALTSAGIDNLAIVTGYQRECLVRPNLTEIYNPNWNSTNMVGSMLCASDLLAKHECIISYSDIVYGQQIVDSLINSPTSKLAIAYDVNWLDLWSRRFGDATLDAESFKMNGDEIVEIGKKITSVEDTVGQYMGLFKMTPIVWNFVLNYLTDLGQNYTDKLDMTSLLNQLIEQGTTLLAVPNSEVWYEVDSQEDLAIYSEMPPINR